MTQTRNAAELYDLRTRHIAFDFPAINALIPADSQVLEVGAGTGRIIQQLRSKNCQIVAVELNPDAAEILRQRFSCDSHIQVKQGDFLSLSIHDNFDVVLFSFDVFSEFRSVENRIAAINHAGHLLRPGGSVILFNTVITSPNELSNEARFEFVIGDAESGQFDCRIACQRSALFGISHCSVEYQSVSHATATIVRDNFTRALLSRNELLTLFTLHPELECVEEFDARSMSSVTERTETIVHILRRRK